MKRKKKKRENGSSTRGRTYARTITNVSPTTCSDKVASNVFISEVNLLADSEGAKLNHAR